MNELEAFSVQETALWQADELDRCNQAGGPFGLTLSGAQMERMARARTEVLRETGRIEFGPGILSKLAAAFCGSPYLHAVAYEDTLAQLQWLFYQWKGACREICSDDELIAAMALIYQACGGSLDYMAGVEPDTVARIARRGCLGRGELFGEEELYE